MHKYGHAVVVSRQLASHRSSRRVVYRIRALQHGIFFVIPLSNSLALRAARGLEISPPPPPVRAFSFCFGRCVKHSLPQLADFHRQSEWAIEIILRQRLL